jgi:hypothetical protein
MLKKVLFLMLSTWVVSALAYDKPNSVAYYPSVKAYFISNLAGKTITKLDSNFDKTDIIKGLTRPKDILFASFGPYNGLLILDSNEVKVYDADGYSYIASFNVPGAIDLEDAEADKTTPGTFYISDPLAHKIFKVVVGPAPFYTPVFTTLNSNVRNPKALLFDSKNRLLVTTDTTKSAVYSINTSTGNASLVNTTSIDNINSIEEDLQGNFYATSWGNSYFYRLDKDFKNAKDLAMYSKPAGLFFNKDYDVIVLACSNCNKVEFYKLHMVYINDVDTAKCPGDTFNVNVSLQFKGKGTYNSSNTFYVELSDANGKFSSAILIGSEKTTTEPSNYRVVLPPNRRFNGSNYKIRVRSTSPAFYSLNEMEVIVPYIPTINISNKDTIFFCNNTTLTLGTNKDIDSGFVNYLWFENGKKISNSLSTYQKTYTSQTAIRLIKSPILGNCLLKDSVVIKPSSAIKIPFKDTIKACANTWVYVGGDSINNTKIEWTSKKYPTVKTEFNPKYQLNFNDTFLVKVTSTTGSCSSQKNIYAYKLPNPYIDCQPELKTCYTGFVMPIGTSNTTGNWNTLKYAWHPGKNLSDSTIIRPVFITAARFTKESYKLIVVDTVTKCYDSAEMAITTYKRPVKPLLAKNVNGVVIRNFDKAFAYKWFKNDTMVQIASDSQFVFPSGKMEWGMYKVTVVSKDSGFCADTSEIFKLTNPNSLNTINKNSFLVYPNPAHDKLFIKGLKNGMEVKLFDVAGRVIIIKEMTDFNTININTLVAGMYFITINFEGSLQVVNFIKY